MNDTELSIRLFRTVCGSQDNNPFKALRLEVDDGRLTNATDNLNRLLADGINNALESGDIETLRSDLKYCGIQLLRAAASVDVEFFAVSAHDSELEQLQAASEALFCK